jgi:hypothetical protein
VNIADLHLARRTGSDEALAVVRMDQAPGAELVTFLRRLEAVRKAQVVDLGPL